MEIGVGVYICSYTVYHRGGKGGKRIRRDM